MSEKIEFNGQERNIIRYCVEEVLKLRQEQENEISVQILERIFEKLKKLRDRELADGTNDQSIFL